MLAETTGSMDETTKRYRILSRIGEGGMAEVFAADMFCQTGYQKTVAVKRVLPRLVRNERFMTMFRDEARLGMLLNHANIVHVFDVGHASETYFIVMEHVDGVSLRDLMDTYEARGELIPLPIALLIAVEVCRGLDYAHNLCDRNGAPLRVIHHDVNPSNVLLSGTGEVKLVDFGLAEAAFQAHRTDPDLLRGKFGYLSPEVASGEPLMRAPTSLPSVLSPMSSPPAGGCLLGRTTWTVCDWLVRR